MISVTALIERCDPAQNGCGRNSLARRCRASTWITLRPPATIIEA
jgi:hypothetical protein